jgi:TRAP-type mannitol/chloroaromatic compound transport system permease small subunit
MKSVIRIIGQGVSWFSLVLVMIIVTDVLLRYLFNYTSVASFELEWHLFAALFMLAAAWTLQQDRHVRVDLFYQRFSEKGKAWVNMVGTLFFLMPFCWVAAQESLSFVQSAYEMKETSPDPGGLPARFLIKSVIPVSFAMLFIQGLLELINSILVITKSDSDESKKS